MKRIAVTLVLVAVVVVGLFAGRRLMRYGAGNGKPETDVKLMMDSATGVCKVTEPVEDLGGYWKTKIRWNVKNVDCEVPQYVAFLEYRKRTDSQVGGEIEHVVDPDPAYSKRVDRGGTDQVDGKIDKFNGDLFNDKRYKYKICVGPNPQPTGNCLDPDVDVWPF